MFVYVFIYKLCTTTAQAIVYEKGLILIHKSFLKINTHIHINNENKKIIERTFI